jgi:outer membrane protein assembly factor BamB
VSGSEYIAAFDESNADEIWRSKVDSIFIDLDNWGNGPSSTPTIDEEYIYSFSSFGKLTANSKKDGRLIWQVDFVKEFGSVPARWGDASSPILVDEMLIMEAGGTDSRAFIAFNKKNGTVDWAFGNGDAYYNSPLLVTIDGQRQVIFTNGRTLYSFNTEGDTLWTYQMPFSNIKAMPVLIGQDKIFISGVRNPGFIIVQINNNKVNKVIDGNSMKNDYSSSCYLDGYIFGFHVAALRCISAETGEVKWTKRGMGKGSLIMVDDKLLVLSDQGKLTIVDAIPDAYKEESIIQALNGKSWTAPSFSNGKVYLQEPNRNGMLQVKIVINI